VPTARWLAFFAPVAAALAAASACGSRTGLLVPPQDASTDVAPDVGPDVSEEPDAAEEDALPQLDVIEEPINICPDAGSTLIYLITSQSVLMSFYPPTGTFQTIGTISCPEPPGSNPFSMAVDRTSGLAYVEFYYPMDPSRSGHLYRVTTTSPPKCMPTPFLPGQGGYPLQFGMGFSANAVDAATPETLYVAGDTMGVGQGNGILATIDTTTFGLTQIGQFTPTITGVELTGTGSGELFAFYATDSMMLNSAIGQIDRATAQIVGQANLPGLAMGSGWAFAFWGGDFYLFTAPPSTAPSSIVTRYRPSDGSSVQVAQATNLTIVGAGVSTCAPQQ
jgi:hypothetical protein